MDKAQELLTLIKHYNREYRQGTPEVSDQEYDDLVAQLKAIDPDNAWFSAIEPGYVGINRKVKLMVPMKSLRKVKSIQELQTWIKSLNLNEETSESLFVITPKFDGLSLLYDEHRNMAYSRGGSINEGQDCSAHINFAKIETNPDSQLDFTYGEFVFSRPVWESAFANRISPETNEVYKSPRNTAAGLLNRDEPSRNLRFVDFYRYGTDETSLQKFKTYTSLFSYLCRTYNQNPLYYVVCAEDIDEEMLYNLFKKWSEFYFIDGLVLYVNDLKIWDRVGRQANTGNPNYAVAYKNPDFTEVMESAVKDVTWNINKSGALKPVVNIEKVHYGDCIIECPTGYNAKWIRDNKVGPGAIVRLTRSGGVIPKILEITAPATSDSCLPTHCPVCGSPLRWNDSMVEICCSNNSCPGKALAKIIHFYTIVGMENMGEETITKMFNAGFTTLRSMLNITFDEILDIEGMGECIANVILRNNSRIKEGIEVTTLMHASDCFNGIGQFKAEKLLSSMNQEDRFAFVNGHVKIHDNYDQSNEFQSLNKTWQSFFMGIVPFYKFISENGLVILPMAEKPQATSNKYENMKVCFTGVRDKRLEETITLGGGEIVNGVSQKTTHLIVADKDSTSSKTQKAKKLGIPIMTIEEFQQL